MTDHAKCPCCHTSVSVVLPEGDASLRQVQCLSCGVRGPRHNDAYSALAAWDALMRPDAIPEAAEIIRELEARVAALELELSRANAYIVDLARSNGAAMLLEAERDDLRKRVDGLDRKLKVEADKRFCAVLRERSLSHSEYRAIREERDVLRGALRDLRPLQFPTGVEVAMEHLCKLTPEQREACGWPDQEEPKTMTWAEALAAIKEGKHVRRRHGTWWPAGLQRSTNGDIVCVHSAVPPTLRPEDFEATDWEIAGK
jgi:hypothetical protein